MTNSEQLQNLEIQEYEEEDYSECDSNKDNG
jgi:hypothetical protein